MKIDSLDAQKRALRLSNKNELLEKTKDIFIKINLKAYTKSNIEILVDLVEGHELRKWKIWLIQQQSNVRDILSYIAKYELPPYSSHMVYTKFDYILNCFFMAAVELN